MSFHEDVDINVILANRKRIKEQFWGAKSKPVFITSSAGTQLDAPEPQKYTDADIAALEMVRPKAARDIVSDTCAHAGISPSLALSASRKPREAKTRQCIMWRLKRERGYSCHHIGTMLGRDHATIIHGVKQVDRAIEGMPATWASVVRSGILSR